MDTEGKERELIYLFTFYVSYLNTHSLARLIKIEWMVDK